MVEHPELRVSDAERLRVVDHLRRHLGEGRLDLEEFEERTDLAFKARTMGDLEPLLADLPILREGPSGPPVRALERRRSKDLWSAGFQIHFYVWLLLSIFLVLIAAATGSGIWPIYPFAGVGLSVGIHAAVRKAVLDR